MPAPAFYFAICIEQRHSVHSPCKQALVCREWRRCHLAGFHALPAGGESHLWDGGRQVHGPLASFSWPIVRLMISGKWHSELSSCPRQYCQPGGRLWFSTAAATTHAGTGPTKNDLEQLNLSVWCSNQSDCTPSEPKHF